MAGNSGSHLFTYGSLMFPEVWQRVVGHESEGTKGKLAGFSAFRVRGQGYPGLVEAGPESATNGVLYRNLSEQDWAKLDEFEGSFYRRTEVEIETEEGVESAHTYVVEEQHRDDLSSDLWDRDVFEKTGLQQFIRNYIQD